ncbi:MAG: hypothetical protein EWV71_07245 [Microcystis flos-aquae Mf_QC_C_20070823_S20D]|nr:MAG: hypothetical protein EWV65_18940 [Microcystis flos-aquae Ma_QC_C_20070823_S18D]TRV37326.1 MAG: hypothetical protein EWV70_06865 [Microcystis flos-aquae Mf_QC_C_20070823_S20]TRV38429.1 MAG: hypothetical protein EWV71_07245 [Microcystis flos-aquae Mf_QC_C_20070823_S20D]
MLKKEGISWLGPGNIDYIFLVGRWRFQLSASESNRQGTPRKNLAIPLPKKKVSTSRLSASQIRFEIQPLLSEVSF